MNWKNIEFINIEKSIYHIQKHNITLNEIYDFLKNKFFVKKVGEKIYQLLGDTNGRILVLFVDYIEGNKFFLLTA